MNAPFYITPSELNIVLYIVKRVQIKDFHNIFKILFWADRLHLVNYGRKLSEDNYVVMAFGPAPSNLYDYFKSIKNSKDDFFQVAGYIVTPLKDPDLDFISESEKECLDKTIADYDKLGFDERTELSHGFAYNNAKKFNNRFINDLDIAFEGGANEELLKFISATN